MALVWLILYCKEHDLLWQHCCICLQRERTGGGTLVAKSHRHHLRTSSLKTRPCSRAIWCCKCTENKLYCHDIFYICRLIFVILKLIFLYFTQLLSMHLYKLSLNKITYRFNVLNSIKYCTIKHFYRSILATHRI